MSSSVWVMHSITYSLDRQTTNYLHQQQGSTKHMLQNKGGFIIGLRLLVLGFTSAVLLLCFKQGGKSFRTAWLQNTPSSCLQSWSWGSESMCFYHCAPVLRCNWAAALGTGSRGLSSYRAHRRPVLLLHGAGWGTGVDRSHLLKPLSSPAHTANKRSTLGAEVNGR